jgi:hypothetical protein
MTLLYPTTVAALSVLLFGSAIHACKCQCRNQPGDPGYPTATDWSALNDTIGGRLLNVVPSAEACRELACTEAQWESGIFRQTIPGSMNSVGVLTRSLLLLMTLLFAHSVQLGAGKLSQPTLSFLPSQLEVHPAIGLPCSRWAMLT